MGGEAEEALGAAAAFGGGFAGFGSCEAFGSEAVEGGMDGADIDCAACAGGDLLAVRNAVSIVTEMGKSEED